MNIFKENYNEQLITEFYSKLNEVDHTISDNYLQNL